MLIYFQTSLDLTRLERVSTMTLLQVGLIVHQKPDIWSIVIHMVIPHVGLDSRVFMAVGP